MEVTAVALSGLPGGAGVVPYPAVDAPCVLTFSTQFWTAGSRRTTAFRYLFRVAGEFSEFFGGEKPCLMDRIASPQACVWCGRTSASGFDGKVVDVLGRQRRFGGADDVQHCLACFGGAVPRPLIKRGDRERASPNRIVEVPC